MTRLRTALLSAVVCVTSIAAAQAGTYSVFVEEGLTDGYGFAATNVSPFIYGPGNNVAAASFSYTGPLNFANTQPQNIGPTGDLNSAFGFSTSNISNYSGAGSVVEGGTTVANYATLGSFLGSSGSAANYPYGSYYAFDLGTLSAGTILTITHDDGASVWQGGSRIGSTTDGPTSAVTDTVSIGRAGDTVLDYSRQNGTPSVLQVSVAEPASLSVLGAGLLGPFMARRRRRVGNPAA